MFILICFSIYLKTKLELESISEYQDIQNIWQLKEYIKPHLDKINYNGLLKVSVEFDYHTCIITIDKCNKSDLQYNTAILTWFYNSNKKKYIDELSDCDIFENTNKIRRLNKLIKIYNVLDKCSYEESMLIDYIFHNLFGLPSIFDFYVSSALINEYDKIYNTLVETDLLEHINSALMYAIGGVYGSKQ